MHKKNFETRLAGVTSSRSVIRLGILLLILFFGAFGIWSATAPLSSAVVARGWIIKEGRSQKISHAHGGVVADIQVREGDRVVKGQLLARIEGPEKASQMEQTRVNLETLTILEKRLSAELSGHDFKISASHLDRFSPLSLSDQEALFFARKKALQESTEELQHRKTALEQQLSGKQRELASLKVQLHLLKEQTDVQTHLLEKGAISKANLRLAKAQLAQQQTLYEATRTELGLLPHKISEIGSQLARKRSEFTSSVLKELADVRSEIAVMEKRLATSSKLAARTNIVAPVNGVIDKSHINTIGAAAPAYTPLFDIVPTDAAMLVEAKVSPSDIEEIILGQSARLSLSAFDQSEFPPMNGKVKFISPDTRKSDSREAPNYVVRLSFAPTKGDSNLPKLVPGMPIEVFVEKSEQTFLQIMLDPFLKSLQRSFKS